jgi:hypothetical protein
MFRAEIHWLADGPTLKMEGRLIGAWAEQAKSLVTKNVVPKGLMVDLSDVSYVDKRGEELLNWLGSIGAKFVATNVYAGGICERLNLPVLERPSSQHRQVSAGRNHKPSPAILCD